MCFDWGGVVVEGRRSLLVWKPFSGRGAVREGTGPRWWIWGRLRPWDWVAASGRWWAPVGGGEERASHARTRTWQPRPNGPPLQAAAGACRGCPHPTPPPPHRPARGGSPGPAALGAGCTCGAAARTLERGGGGRCLAKAKKTALPKRKKNSLHPHPPISQLFLTELNGACPQRNLVGKPLMANKTTMEMCLRVYCMCESTFYEHWGTTFES